MSTRKDRLGRNPFDRGTYSRSATEPASGSHKKAKKRTRAKRATKAPAWRLVLDELNRRSPRAIRQLHLCERVAALTELVTTSLRSVMDRAAVSRG